jgi:urease gamma subunit
MAENKKKTRGVSLRKPEDVKRICAKVVSDIFREGSQIENAGKINQLLLTFLRADRQIWELGEFLELKERVEKLMEERKSGRRW